VSEFHGAAQMGQVAVNAVTALGPPSRSSQEHGPIFLSGCVRPSIDNVAPPQTRAACHRPAVPSSGHTRGYDRYFADRFRVTRFVALSTQRIGYHAPAGDKRK